MKLEFSKAELPQMEDLEFLKEDKFLLSGKPFWALEADDICWLGKPEYLEFFPKRTDSGEIFPVLYVSAITEIQPGDLMKPGDSFMAKGLPFIILGNGKIMVTSSIGSFSISDDGKSGDGWSHYLYKGSDLQEIIDGWFDYFFND